MARPSCAEKASLPVIIGKSQAVSQVALDNPAEEEGINECSLRTQLSLKWFQLIVASSGGRLLGLPLGVCDLLPSIRMLLQCQTCSDWQNFSTGQGAP